MQSVEGAEEYFWKEPDATAKVPMCLLFQF